jgi:Ca-activated chloride channel homolog
MRSLTCSLGWVQRAFTLLLLILMATGAGLPGHMSPRSAAAAPATQDQQAVRTVNLELILDLSGSMARDIGGGETRMEAAKRVMNDVIDALPEREGVNVGFRIYGHLGDNTEAGRAVSCQSSELVLGGL